MVLVEFDVHTTETVMTEIEETADYDDTSREAPRRALRDRKDLTVLWVDDLGLEFSRINTGEGSCAALTQDTASFSPTICERFPNFSRWLLHGLRCLRSS